MTRENPYRTMRLKRSVFDRIVAMRERLERQGLNAVPSEILPNKIGSITHGFVVTLALTALDGMLDEETRTAMPYERPEEEENEVKS